ncbi:hypothetical protein ACKC9G_18360 [Pokkaliibacter sp. CJK22405]|uniref:hypothetical protein n=1 Tax=Pokkaliibacter sp. CJK22405 TaxID=3384615 RepID=UPI003984D0CB
MKVLIARCVECGGIKAIAADDCPDIESSAGRWRRLGLSVNWQEAGSGSLGEWCMEPEHYVETHQAYASELGCQIYKAIREIPEGYEIQLKLTRYNSEVSLSDGSVHIDNFNLNTIGAQIDNALKLAEELNEKNEEASL